MSISQQLVIKGAFVVFMAIGLWIAGRRISKYFLKRDPASPALSKVTGTGFAIFPSALLSCFPLVWPRGS
jgi:hypothetical protein